MRTEYIQICKKTASILTVAAVGLLCGRLILGALERSFVAKPSAAYLMVKYPAGSFLSITSALSDPDPSVRVAGYYGAYEHGFASSGLLMERLDSETDPMVRKAIVYVLYNVSKKDYNRVIKKHPELERKKGRIINNPSSVF